MEKKTIIVIAVKTAVITSTISALPSNIEEASCTDRRDAHIANNLKVALKNKSRSSVGRVTVSMAHADASPKVLLTVAIPAVTVFIASLTDDPITGIIFAAANFIPFKDALSLLVARIPLSVMIANRKEKEKIMIETRFFFRDLVMPSEANSVERLSVTKIPRERAVKGKKQLENI